MEFTVCTGNVLPEAAVLFVVATASTVVHVFTSRYSAEEQLKALKILLEKTRAAHLETTVILKALPAGSATEQEFQNLDFRTYKLARWDKHSSLLDRNI